MKKRVLFLCTHNSARSQMAEGLLKFYKGGSYDAHSAGTEPTIVHPLAIEAMREKGIDISSSRSKSLHEFDGMEFDLAVTLCDAAGKVCPFFPGAKEMAHRGFDDPAAVEGNEEARLEAFRRVRDEILDWLLASL
ncbi:MAG: arsenate reductase ArsC [Methanobacteriota archaeon]